MSLEQTQNKQQNKRTHIVCHNFFGLGYNLNKKKRCYDIHKGQHCCNLIISRFISNFKRKMKFSSWFPFDHVIFTNLKIAMQSLENRNACLSCDWLLSHKKIITRRIREDNVFVAPCYLTIDSLINRNVWHLRRNALEIWNLLWIFFMIGFLVQDTQFSFNVPCTDLRDYFR